MSQPNDLNKSVTALEQHNTLIAVIEMGQASWLVAGIVPGLERRPLKKLGSDEQALLQLLQRWRNEAVKAGRVIKRLVVAYEAGRDGFWLARWLRGGASRFTSLIRRASPCRVSTDGQRLIGSTPNS